MIRLKILLTSILLFFAIYGNSSVIKGMLYQPEYPLDKKKILKDVLQLKELGATTIISDLPIINKEVLDVFYQNEIKIIMVLPHFHKILPCLLNQSYLTFVTQFKNHPAIEMWAVGMADNYNPYANAGNISGWYNKVNEFATSIKLIDSQHSITSINGGIPPQDIVSKCEAIDIWGLQVFSGTDLSGIIRQWEGTYSKPMFLISGIDSYNHHTHKNSEQMQANGLVQLMNSILKEPTQFCKGLLIVSFKDNHKLIKPLTQGTKGAIAPEGHFGGDGISDIEYFGILKNNRKKKQVYKVVKHFFNDWNQFHF